MILHPSIIALVLSSAFNSFLLLYASWYGLLILRRWDIRSGSSLQLELERRTYLISTILVWVFTFQLFSLFLYVFTADRLSTLFTGAMCAAGSLQVNGFGYPTLGFKLLNFVLAGLWLILNRADMQAEDYPLIRVKYALLLVLLPLILIESLCQTLYFTRLAPDVITSCCGSLFGGQKSGFAADLSSLPMLPAAVWWYGTAVVCLAMGIFFYRFKAGGYFLALLSAALLASSIAAVLSFISVYVYELPTHHCPFCLLQAQYGYVGFVFYAALGGGSIAGIGIGALMPFRSIKSLALAIPGLQKKLSLILVISICILLLVVTSEILFSNYIIN